MTLELTHWIDPEELARTEKLLSLKVDKAQMDAISDRIGTLSLDHFTVEMRVTRGLDKGTYVLHGALEGDVVQACVTSLKPVPSHVSDNFEVILAPVGYDIPDDDEEDWSDDIEIITPNGVDVGEIAVQYLLLALNPFPRAEGAKVTDLEAKGVRVMTEDEVSEMQNPFQILKGMTEKD